MSVRPRPVTTVSVDERVSLTAVVEAVADIMEASNRGGVVDRALASRIGSQIQIAVADAMGQGRITSGAQLVGQPSFRSILSQHLATTSSVHTDQEARRLMLDFMRNHANRTGSDFANFVAQFRRGGGYGDRDMGRGGDAAPTSARFDGFSGADAAFLGRMRDVAIRHGLHWAADRPEILRMGEEALRLFARTGLTRESFDRLKEAGFYRRQMMTMARFAERTGMNLNDIARVQTDSIAIFGGNSEAERRRWREMIDKYNAAPEGVARDELRTELERMQREGTSAQRVQAGTHLQQIDQATQALNTANTLTLQSGAATLQAATATTEADAATDQATADTAAVKADSAQFQTLLAGAPTPAPGIGPPSPVPAPGTGTQPSPAVVTQPAPPTPTAPPTGQQVQAAATQAPAPQR